MTRKILYTCLLLLPFLTGTGQKIDDLQFLTGTWKVEGKETYEVWEKVNAHELKGSSYKIKNGKKVVTEHLSLKSADGKVVYEATVLNQNDAKPIPFTLSDNTTQGFSFENPGHDFPTKIRYQKINDSKLVVHVLGADDKGFSLTFIRE